MGTANPLTSYCIRVASRREPPAPREFDGEERSGPNLAQPKADWGQTRPSLALSWGQLAPTWAQLGSNMAQLGHLWMQVGLSMCNLILHGGIWRRSGPKTSQCGTWPRTNPHQSQKTLDTAAKRKFSACLIESTKMAPVGREPTWPKRGRKLRCLEPDWSPSWRKLVMLR